MGEGLMSQTGPSVAQRRPYGMGERGQIGVGAGAVNQTADTFIRETG
jgi:hypothetical protein